MIDILRLIKAILAPRNIHQRGKLFVGVLKLMALKSKDRQKNNGEIRLHDYVVHYGEYSLMEHLYKEIFVNQCYHFDCEHLAPIIIDAGANIGIAMLYFKWRFPSSKIVCFEPDPRSFSCLQKNVELNDLSDVDLYPYALSNRDGQIDFYIGNNLDAGDIGASTVKALRLYYHDRNEIKNISVPCKELSSFISSYQVIDLLKLDIEGSESSVIDNIQQDIRKFKNIIMEYHYIYSQNSLSEILRVLEDNGFFYRIIGIDSYNLMYTLIISAKNQNPISY